MIICTKKMPTTTETKSKETDLMATIIGIARRMYLVKIEPNLIKPALGRDCLMVIGMDFPKRIKLIILKQVPRIRPLAIAFS